MFPGRRSAIIVVVTCFFVLCCIGIGRLAADELHKKDGSIVYGLFKRDGKSSVKFLEVGNKRAKTYRKKDIQRIVLTWGLPDFVYSDPEWSREMVQARKEASFDPAWGEVEVMRSDHYIVFTNSSAGKRYLKTMEDIYDKFKKTYPFEDLEDASLMPVFLFKTNDQYYRFYAKIANNSISRAKMSGGHSWKDYYATYYQAPKDPVHYHEGAHQLVKQRLRTSGGGSWFQEGLAVYFEGVVFKSEDPSIGMKTEVRTGRYIRLREMVALRSLLHSRDTESTASHRYRQAGAIMKFLVEGPDKERFPQLVEAVRSGDSWEEIFRNVYGRSIDEMDLAFVDFYKDYKR